jgi:antitoxin component YwqK of YwqJK toxin-antitoxin module
MDGLVTSWYENGQKKIEGTWKDGKLISFKKWNEDGSVEE